MNEIQEAHQPEKSKNLPTDAAWSLYQAGQNQIYMQMVGKKPYDSMQFHQQLS